jgi:hypothetical protein
MIIVKKDGVRNVGKERERKTEGHKKGKKETKHKSTF